MSDHRYEKSTTLRGYDVIRDPLLNKGTAFTPKERIDLELEGLLPAQTNTLEQQLDRIHASLQFKPTPLEKYIGLAGLQERNETLFYKLLSEHVEDYMPIIYTPTVGTATKYFSNTFRRGRGVWITPDHKGRMQDVLKKAAEGRDIQLMVVTDSESILGIGDQGAGGIAISIGKLALYTVGAGIYPGCTLPVCLDFGTNNETLLKDPMYLGWHSPRLSGDAYDHLVDEFVEAVKEVFPNALLQWEDLRKDNARRVLDKYRHEVLSFNDDIQGTGAVALAGLLSALRINNGNYADQRVIMFGGGAAGQGVAKQLRAKFLEQGVSEEDLPRHVAVLDRDGLIVDDREELDPYKAEIAWPQSLADEIGVMAKHERQLQTLIQRFKPTVLMGAAGVGGAFDEHVIKAMCKFSERPVIMPFSNPTEYAEAVPKDIVHWSKGRALIATGSPFAPVEYKGKTLKFGQGNNVFIFPGVGLGALLSGATEVTDNMVNASAEALAAAIHQDNLDKGLLYPNVSRLREATAHVALAVALRAVEDGVATKDIKGLTLDDVEQSMWTPDYPTINAV